MAASRGGDHGREPHFCGNSSQRFPAYDEWISRQYLREITYSRLSIRELRFDYHLPRR